MPGAEVFTRINFGKETVKGTPVARTRRFYGVAAGNFDIGDQLNFHETENRGQRTRINAKTPVTMRGAPSLKIQDIDGIAYDDLVDILSAGFRGGQTGAGAGADKTWTLTQQNTASNAPESLSVDVGDDVQNWILQYGMLSDWTLSTTFGEKTHFSGTLFAQQAIKGAASAPAENTGVIIPSDLWTLKYATTFAGLGAASVNLNYLRTWSMDYDSGFRPRYYQDGTLYMGQHVETDIVTTFHFEVESTALAVSELVDKWRAGTQDYIRLKITGPSLGASNYSVQIDSPVYWDNVKPIASMDDGVVLYTADGRGGYDGTNGLVITLVCTLAAIP